MTLADELRAAIGQDWNRDTQDEFFSRAAAALEEKDRQIHAHRIVREFLEGALSTIEKRGDEGLNGRAWIAQARAALRAGEGGAS